MYGKRRILALLISISLLMAANMPVQAEVAVSALSVILMEASTGQVIYEVNATERRCPASITKIMTLLLAFEQLDAGKIKL